MAVNPCCGNDLQRGTRIVAIVEIIWYALGLLVQLGIILFLVVAGVAVAASKKQQERDGDPEANTNWGLIAVGAIALTIFGILLCFFSILSIVFGVILLKGSNSRDPGKCKAWLIFRVVMWVLSFFGLLVFANIFALWEILVTPYFIWVTYAYLQELRNGSPQGQGVVYSQSPNQQEKV